MAQSVEHANSAIGPRFEPRPLPALFAQNPATYASYERFGKNSKGCDIFSRKCNHLSIKNCQSESNKTKLQRTEACLRLHCVFHKRTGLKEKTFSNFKHEFQLTKNIE